MNDEIDWAFVAQSLAQSLVEGLAELPAAIIRGVMHLPATLAHLPADIWNSDALPAIAFCAIAFFASVGRVDPRTKRFSRPQS